MRGLGGRLYGGRSDDSDKSLQEILVDGSAHRHRDRRNSLSTAPRVSVLMRGDVIIVGSGPAAVSAAFPLVESGCSVTMLDAAEHNVPDPPLADINEFRRGDKAWRHAFGDNFMGLRLGSDRSPKFATRIGQAALASDAEFPPVQAVKFVPIRSFIAGGLSKIWGAFATTFDNEDLREYPFCKCDLTESYRAIAARIGISGRNDD